MLSSSHFASGVAADTAGNVYVAGEINAWVDFDPASSEAWAGSAGNNDGFLAKYGPDKSLQWIRRLTSTGYERLSDVAVGTDGYVYVAGAFRGAPTFGAVTLSTLSCAAFVAKLDPLGNIVWAEKLGDGDGAVSTVAGRIALDGQDNLYINGYFMNGTGDFDPTEGVKLLTAQGEDSFVVQLKADGTFGWATSLGGSSIEANALAADATGVYTGGRFSGTMALSGQTDTVWPWDGYLVKLAAGDGTLAWARQYTDVPVGALAADGVSVYAAAGGDRINDSGPGYTGPGFLAKYEAGGAEQWSQAWPAGVYDMTLAGSRLYLAGPFEDTCDFNPDPAAQWMLTAAGSADVWVAQLTDGGQLLWAGQMGGMSLDWGTATDVDGNGNLMTAGRFRTGLAPADFDPGIGTAAMSSLGYQDVFLSKLAPTGNGFQYAWAFQLGTYDEVRDNGDAGYQESGSGWKSGKTWYGYAHDWRYHSKGSGANKAKWSFTGLPVGQYEVFATWVAQNSNATNAQYVVNGTSAPLINQRLTPDDVQVSRPEGQAYFQRLGIFTADAEGKITVVLSDKANGLVVADAIRVIMSVPAGPVAPTTALSGAELAVPVSSPSDSNGRISSPTSASTEAAFAVLADDPVPVWPATANPAVSALAKVRVAQHTDVFSQKDDLLDDLLGIADEL